MSNIQLIMTILIIGMGTFIFRFSFIFLYGKMKLPQWVHRAMRFVPPAVLSALIFPAILIRDQELWLSLENPRLLAGMVAIAIAWRTKNLLLTIASGLGIFWLIIFF